MPEEGVEPTLSKGELDFESSAFNFYYDRLHPGNKWVTNSVEKYWNLGIGAEYPNYFLPHKLMAPRVGLEPTT